MGKVVAVAFLAVLKSCSGGNDPTLELKPVSEYCEIQRDQIVPLLKSRIPHLTDAELAAIVKQHRTYAKLCS